MKLIITLLTLFLAINIFFFPDNALAISSPEPSASPQSVDVNAVFWPVVPGKTVADSTFWLKQLKETFGQMFTFGTIAKAQYEIGISEKRLVEANKLIQDKDYTNALKSINLNEEARKKALELKKKAVEEKTNTLDLTNKLVKSLENQEKALVSLDNQLPQDQKTKLDQILKDLPLQISAAK